MANAPDRGKHKEEQAKPRQRLHAEPRQAKHAGQKRYDGAYPHGSPRDRSHDKPTGPRPADQEENIAQEQRKTWAHRQASRLEDGWVDEPLICLADREGKTHQEQAAW